MSDQNNTPEIRESLLKEYEMVIKLYMHEDNLALRIMEVSIVINTSLAAAAKFGPASPDINSVLALLGIAICSGWRRIAISSTIHHDLRAFRARAIEAELHRMGTFHDEAAILYYHKPVVFPDLYKPEKPQEFRPVILRRGFVVLENLPILVGIAWLLFFIASIIQFLRLI